MFLVAVKFWLGRYGQTGRSLGCRGELASSPGTPAEIHVQSLPVEEKSPSGGLGIAFIQYWLALLQLRCDRNLRAVTQTMHATLPPNAKFLTAADPDNTNILGVH
jgi:hypothetical protein